MNKVFTAISNWEVDPRDEDMKRLFFQKNGIEDVFSGKKNIVVGRKGSGKTTIAQYIVQVHRSTTKIFNLSDIDFFELNEFSGGDSEQHSKSVIFWRYLIYYMILEILVRQNLLDYKLIKLVRSVINIGSDEDFARRVSYLRNLNFKLSAFGAEAEIKAERNFSDLSISEKCAIFEDILKKYRGSDKIFIIFDELDSKFDVSDNKIAPEYENLVKSLMIAALEVQRRINKIIPIVLIRDDIFDVITRHFSESNKLIDKTFKLTWSTSELIKMCEHRLSAEINKNIKFEQLFNNYAVSSKILRNRRHSKVSMVEFFFEHTMLRPRDIILFLREISRICLESKVEQIGSNIIRAALPRYSTRFKQELIDEIHSSVSNIADIFDSLTTLRRSHYVSDELSRFILKKFQYSKEESIKIMNILFYFSVIGISEGSEMKYRYIDSRARFVSGLNVELHPGIRQEINFFAR
jgi:adenylate kinase family enzyme